MLPSPEKCARPLALPEKDGLYKLKVAQVDNVPRLAGRRFDQLACREERRVVANHAGIGIAPPIVLERLLAVEAY